jgi:alpha-galactosidase
MQHEMSEARVKEEIDVAAALGAELFIVDAGWFADPGTNWFTTVGDWTPGGRLPRGFAPLVDHAHEQGLLFGAWVEAERISPESRAYAAHPEWVLRYQGQELPAGPLDLTIPEAAAWMESEICRVIADNRLDLFRLDHNVYVWQGGQRDHAGFRESTLWRQCLALWGIFDRVHERFPQVLLENCAGGGGRTDLGMQRRFHYVQISDCTALPRALRIMNGSTMFLPPEACFNFTGVGMEAHARGDLDSQFRGVTMGKPCLSGFAPSFRELDPVTLARGRHHVEIYKQFLRPLHEDSLVYHHTPVLPGVEPAGWWVQEYFSPSLRRGAVGLFRLVSDGRDTWQLQARGVRRDKTYRVTFDNTGETVEMSGQALRDPGLAVRLPAPMTSELLLLEEE